MAIAEEAEKGSHGEGGGGRGASTASQTVADTSPPPQKKGMKRLGQSIDFVFESPISLYHYYYCFSHHKLQEIFYTIYTKKWGVGEDF